MAQRGKKPIPKTQREISISQQEPYVNPDTGETRGNPNDAANLNNRGKQTSFRNDDVKPFELGFKEIDESIFYYMENVIKPKIDQNGVIQKVPIIYGSPERWKQIQKDGYYRDKKGKIMMPLITFKRVNIEKNRTLTNKLDANNPNNLHVFEKKYSPKNTYDNFNILNNRIPKKQFYAVVVPDYVTITYDFIISTYYVEQLNKLIESMSYASDSYWGNPERFKFKAMIDSFATPIELNQGGERIVKSTFQLKLHGYLVPNTIQKQLNSIKKYSNKNSIIFTTEVVNTLDDTQIRDTQDRTEINVSDEFPSYAQSQSSPSPENNLLLDDLTGSTGAFSLRKLKSSYSGKAIQVRRASDNTTQDIGFVNNQLDTASLNTFCSGTDGFVTIWYNQSDTSNNAIQTTAANQPKIYDLSTGCETNSGKPSINFIGANDNWLEVTDTSFGNIGDVISNFSVSHLTTGTGNIYPTIIGKGIFADGTHQFFRFPDANKFTIRVDGTNHSTGYDNFGATRLISNINTLSTVSIYADSVQILSASNSQDLTGTNTLKFYIGKNSQGSANNFRGFIQEIILFSNDQASNRTTIETDINANYSIY